MHSEVLRLEDEYHAPRVDGWVNYFWSDCSCGWASGFTESVGEARDLHRAHVRTRRDAAFSEADRIALDLRRITRCTCGEWRWDERCGTCAIRSERAWEKARARELAQTSPQSAGTLPTGPAFDAGQGLPVGGAVSSINRRTA